MNTATVVSDRAWRLLIDMLIVGFMALGLEASRRASLLVEPTTRTYRGRLVRPFDLRPDDVDLIDIAHHLSKMCRFGGAVEGDDTIYSVAEHAVRVSIAVEDEARRLLMTEAEILDLAEHGLHHDDEEFVLPDLPGPIKHHPEMYFYREAGKRAQRVICGVLGLAPDEPPLVKEVDRRMCATEQRDIVTDSVPDDEPLQDRIVPWTPADAKCRYLDRAAELSARRCALLANRGDC